MNKEILDINWADFPDAESRIDTLRKRDVEVSSISKGLQMRTRISQLETENALLKSMEAEWLLNRTGRLYFMIPRSLLKLFRKITSR